MIHELAHAYHEVMGQLQVQPWPGAKKARQVDGTLSQPIMDEQFAMRIANLWARNHGCCLYNNYSGTPLPDDLMQDCNACRSDSECLGEVNTIGPNDHPEICPQLDFCPDGMSQVDCPKGFKDQVGFGDQNCYTVTKYEDCQGAIDLNRKPYTPLLACGCGKHVCKAKCTDVLRNPDNCGDCGKGCASDKVCRRGVCQSPECKK